MVASIGCLLCRTAAEAKRSAPPRSDLAALPKSATYLPVSASGWKFTTQKPAKGWFRSRFDHSVWKTGPAGFGCKETRGITIRTEWTGREIWVRKSFGIGNLVGALGKTLIAPLSDDCPRFTAEPLRIDPAGERVNAKGRTSKVIGHEGATMQKIGDKYVHFGTACSTNGSRRCSYNLCHCTADEITGPCSPRKFAGRFLGHGTPFRTRDGKWWCTALFNANVPPLDRKGIRDPDLSETAQTINRRGTTIVPLDVRVRDDGEIHIRAKDPDYAVPGADEVQKF